MASREQWSGWFEHGLRRPTMEATMRRLRMLGIAAIKRLLDACLALASRGFNKELDLRNSARGGDSLHWLTPEETAVAEALARIIIPSEEGSPGIDEICIFGPSAVALLDKMIGEGPDRQHFYSRGLLSFDIWAVRQHGCKFAGLPAEQQTSLFRAAQELHDSWTAAASPILKAGRRLRAVTQAGKGMYFAAMLYPMIRDDCIQIFYTSRVSWTWLEYDGPPMEKGYANLTQPR